MNFNRIYNRLIKSAKKIQQSEGLTISLAFDRLLDKGIVYSLRIGSSSFAGLGIEQMPVPNITGLSQEVIEEIGQSSGMEILYVIGSVETYLKYAEARGASGITDQSVMSNDPEQSYPANEVFLASIDSIKNSFDGAANAELNEKGIVEAGNINLNKVKSFLPNFVRDGLFTTSNFGTLLDVGVVISVWIQRHEISPSVSNYTGRVTIASVETFLKYAEAVG
jgi:hypothetical protein